MEKKICISFLLLVMAIQILPVQQMGRALFSNQFTEEMPHAVDADKDFSKKADCKSDYLFTDSFSFSSAFINSPFSHHTVADTIPQNHAGDIHVPPPNC